MNRRSFVSAILAGLAALLRRPLFRRLPPVPFRRLAEPYWIEKGEPIGMALMVEDPPAWSGRIVRQDRPIPGQRELCCSCGNVGCASDESCPQFYAEAAMGRNPVRGSPERAYLEFMARTYPHNDCTWSEAKTLRRIESGELAEGDIFIRLMSAEEIDSHPAFVGAPRTDAFASYINILA